MKNSLRILILFFLIVSCDPCDDCDTVSFEPNASLIFINQSSICAIDDSPEIIEFADNFQEVDEMWNVIVRTENIRVVNESYDSLINCEKTA